MYDIEKYYNAGTVSEAVTLLNEHPDTRIISGGSDVLIKIREGRMAGTSLVSIRDIEELKGIERTAIFISVQERYFHILQQIRSFRNIFRFWEKLLTRLAVRRSVISERLEEISVMEQSVLTVFRRSFPITRYCILQMQKAEEVSLLENFILVLDV
jgi:hypothetical protein